MEHSALKFMARRRLAGRFRTQKLRALPPLSVYILAPLIFISYDQVKFES